jgi:hypothetical protein
MTSEGFLKQLRPPLPKTAAYGDRATRFTDLSSPAMGKTLQAAFRSGWGETLILNTRSSIPPLCGHTNMQPAKGGK